MTKAFNVTGPCLPRKHYMADTAECVRQIRKMIELGAYFTINRARQYGKTTILAALDRALNEDYLVIWLDFQALGSASYQNENKFSLAFLELFLREMERQNAETMADMAAIMEKMYRTVEDEETAFGFMALFRLLLKEIGRASCRERV